MKTEFAKPKTFFFHYNKPSTVRTGKVQMSAHVDGQCLIADAVVCHVPCQSKENKRQPRLVMKGKRRSVELVNGVIHLA